MCLASLVTSRSLRALMEHAFFHSSNIKHKSSRETSEQKTVHMSMSCARISNTVTTYAIQQLWTEFYIEHGLGRRNQFWEPESSEDVLWQLQREWSNLDRKLIIIRLVVPWDRKKNVTIKVWKKQMLMFGIFYYLLTSIYKDYNNSQTSICHQSTETETQILYCYLF